jgi:hypothetical protein
MLSGVEYQFNREGDVMKCISKMIVASMLLMAAGCGASDQTAAAHVAVGNADHDTNTPVGHRRNAVHDARAERFAFVALGMQRTIYEAIQRFLGAILTGASDGDVLHVVATPDHDPIVSVTIPKGGLRTRQKNPEFAQAARKIKEFLDRAADTGASGFPSGQLDLPRMSRTVDHLRQTKGRLAIFAFGDPVYRPDPEHAWRFTDACVPSDAALRADECPFGPMDRVTFPATQGESADVYLIAPGPRWADSGEHRQGIERFYTLYVNELGGRFYGVFPDAESALNKSLRPDQSRPAGLPVMRDETYVGMWSTRQSQLRAPFEPRTTEVPITTMPAAARHELVQPPDTSGGAVPAVPQILDRFLQQVPWDRTAFSIRWFGKNAQYRDSDLDLHIRDAKSGDLELNFHNMQTDFGRLHRDVRTEIEDEDFTQWEYAEISHDRLKDLEVWIDCYKATGNLTCLVRAVWHGRMRETQIVFQVEHGDGCSDRMHRETSDAWKQVSLRGLFSGIDQ